MNNLYHENSANFPRLSTDILFADYGNTFLFDGYISDIFRFVEDFQLIRPDLFKRFVAQFGSDADSDGGWRGEYWGKMMRGACFVYSYTKNPELYRVLRDAVLSLIGTQSEDGRISSYPADNEFHHWDIWSRKYVMLGMQYFLEITDDEELSRKIVASMVRHADCIISHIGEGKLPITSTGCWRGLNSSSVLEPFVRLYSITKEQRFLDFAKYIVDCGGTGVVNIFSLALKDQLFPYQYPLTKAYEMISCFEGLLEYYRITKNPDHLTAVINFANKILESDFTVIGSCGCTHELFDHSTVRQANTDNGTIQQETCVTVTLMKFVYQLTLITGNPEYADAFERSFYNAYLGAVNTEKVIEPSILKNHPNLHFEALPFDSYSPLTAGTRGNGVGGFQIMRDNHYYGCCACIGAAGLGLFPKMAVLSSRDGFAVNLYANGTVKSQTPKGNPITFTTDTKYPLEGTVTITLSLTKEERLELKFRNPSWSRKTFVSVNGEEITATNGYINIRRSFKDGDTVVLSFDMSTYVIRPIPYGTQILMNDVRWELDYVVPTFDTEDPIAKKHIALMRGPLILAQENRLGYSVDDPVSVAVNPDGTVDAVLPEHDTAPYPHMAEVLISLADGEKMTVTDYASAGKLWNSDSKMAAWILTK